MGALNSSMPSDQIANILWAGNQAANVVSEFFCRFFSDSSIGFYANNAPKPLPSWFIFFKEFQIRCDIYPSNFISPPFGIKQKACETNPPRRRTPKPV